MPLGAGIDQTSCGAEQDEAHDDDQPDNHGERHVASDQNAFPMNGSMRPQ